MKYMTHNGFMKDKEMTKIKVVHKMNPGIISNILYLVDCFITLLLPRQLIDD